MSSALAHRGPDGAGFALLDRQRVGLGHVRLSIIDLTSGQQPLHNEDESISLICNGEIYDYKEHRKDLIERGHTFRTHSDSEVILHLYEEYGDEFVNHLNGEFALVLWDGRQRRLVAARDRYGVKPLYYSEREGELLISSEVKGMFALDRVERRFSQRYLVGPAFGVWLTDACLFEGVRSLKPGHMLIATDQQVEIAPYFKQSYHTDHSMTFEEAKERVREEVTAAVRRRLVADVSAHSYLSGGLDSTLVCGLIAQDRTDFTAYNIGFPNSPYDESEQARRTAKYYGAKFESLPCDAATISENVMRTLYHIEMPLVNYNSVAKLLLSEYVNSRGEKVCLTGEGADEMFAGYPFFRLEGLWRDEVNQTGTKRDRKKRWAQFYETEQRSEGYMWINRSDWKKRGIHPLGYPNYFHIRSRMVEQWTRRFYNTSNWKPMTESGPEQLFASQYDYDAMSSLDPINSSRQVSLNFLFQMVIPCLGDRVEMANSLECRTPFLDPNVTHLASTLPPEYLVDMNTLSEKHVLRSAFQDLLPPEIRTNKKHPFLAPSWKSFITQKAGREIFREFFSAERIAKAGVLNIHTMRGLLAFWKYFPKKQGLSRQCDTLTGTLLSLQILHHLFIENRVERDPQFPMEDRSPTGKTSPVLNAPVSS